MTQALIYLIGAQQTIVILMSTPAFAAGSLTDEKRRGTLDFLLSTPLSSVEIVVGKWFGQATRVFSPGFVLLMLLAGAVGEGGQPVVLAIAEQLALVYSLTAMSLLASIWSRSTPRAILTVYLCLAVAVFAEWTFRVPTLGAGLWMPPLGMSISVQQRLEGIGWLGVVTLTCLALAAWRLRPAHERQKAARPPVLVRWWDRPAIGDAPMRWKERFIGDWMSIPIWGALPRWFKHIAFAAAVGGCALAFPRAEAFFVLGAVQFLSSGLFVGIRAAGCVTSEREMQTWESLLVTRLDARQLVRGKLWGHIDAVRPYMVAYLVPAAGIAWWIDPLAFFAVSYGWLASWVFLYYIGTIGVTTSIVSNSTWQGILMTLVRSVSSLAISQLILTYFVLFLWATLIMFMLPGAWQNAALIFGSVLAPIPGLLWLFAVSEERLQNAEQNLIDSEHAAASP